MQMTVIAIMISLLSLLLSLLFKVPWGEGLEEVSLARLGRASESVTVGILDYEFKLDSRLINPRERRCCVKRSTLEGVRGRDGGA